MWMDFAGKAFTLPELESVPFVDQLPNPKTVVESSFGFAEELLGTQKDFAAQGRRRGDAGQEGDGLSILLEPIQFAATPGPVPPTGPGVAASSRGLPMTTDT